jgi:tetratricopeptide (TPR) repeat protein
MAASNLGWIYLNEGDHGRARDAFARALAIAPDNGRWQDLLGRSELGLGRLDDAARSFERATALDPQNFDAWIERARTLGRLGRFAESAAVLADAIAAAATFPEDRRALLLSTLHQYRGEMLVAAGDPAGAAAESEASRRVLREGLDRARTAGDTAQASALEARLAALEAR